MCVYVCVCVGGGVGKGGRATIHLTSRILALDLLIVKMFS